MQNKTYKCIRTTRNYPGFNNLKEPFHFEIYSEESQLKLFDENVSRLSWHMYFLYLAIVASSRSPDAQTKCGCVIVNPKTKHIIGGGFNGFPRGVNDAGLPKTRPEKYQYVLHAESNALDNCETKDLNGCVAYVSGWPCIECAKRMFNVGIHTFYYGTYSKPKMIMSKPEETVGVYTLLYENGLQTYEIDTESLVDDVHNFLKGTSPPSTPNINAVEATS